MTPDQRRIANAYRAGWNDSASGRFGSLDEAEDRYAARGRTAAQQDAWAAGWIDYGADFEKGRALASLLSRVTR